MLANWGAMRDDFGLWAVSLCEKDSKATVRLLPELDALLNQERVAVSVLTSYLLTHHPARQPVVFDALVRALRRDIDSMPYWKKSDYSSRVSSLIEDAVGVALVATFPGLFESPDLFERPLLTGHSPPDQVFSDLLAVYPTKLALVENRVLRALRSEEVALRREGAAFVGAVHDYDDGPLPRRIVTVIVGLLKDSDIAVKRYAANALSDVPFRGVDIRVALRDALRDKDADVRSDAAFALMEYEEGALVALPELLRLVEEEHVGVQRSALRAIGAMWPSARRR